MLLIKELKSINKYWITVLFISIILLFAGCSAKSNQGLSPEEVVDKYFSSYSLEERSNLVTEPERLRTDLQGLIEQKNLI